MPTPDLHCDLSKWQPSNDPELGIRKPDELFDVQFAKRYAILHRLIWERMIRLNETLVILEQLDQFPLKVLYASDDMSFWHLVSQNFRDMFCVILHTLLEDQVDDAHTLPRFKNEIIRTSWQEPRLLALFKRRLAECRFDDCIDSIVHRMREIRNHRIAHVLVDRTNGALKGVMPGVDLSEMRSLFDAAHSFFGALSFGATFITLSGDLMPGTVGGKPKPTCLDRVLDAVLRDSYFVNQPERRGEWWQSDREYIKPQELELMNMLRARVGLRPA